jgi:hypothetical protein
VVRSGEKNTVFVAVDGGHFEPRDVTLGARSENEMLEVLSGVTEGDKIVTSGQFMLDSESQLREAIQKMLGPSAPPATAQTPSQKTIAAAAPPPVSTASPASFVCPMPEHASIRYDHPGKCSICGMTLIPAPADETQPQVPATPHTH